MNTPQDPHHRGDRLITHRHYLELCGIRDKLLLIAQLAGSSTSLNDANAMLYVRRSLLGETFGDLSFQLNAVLSALREADTVEEPESMQ